MKNAIWTTKHDESTKKHMASSLPLSIHATVQGVDGTGGDLLDIRQQPDHVGMTLGDVTGHGNEASPFASRVREVLNNLDENNRNQSSWLEELNGNLMDRLDEDHFCAAISARFEQPDENGNVQANMAIAGLPAPLIIRENGSLEWLQYGSIPLGVDDDQDLLPETVDCELRPGDKLVMFTDGISEAHNLKAQLFGTGGIERVAAALRCVAAQDLLRGLMAAVKNHMGNSQQQDDMSVAIIENTARRDSNLQVA